MKKNISILCYRITNFVKKLFAKLSLFSNDNLVRESNDIELFQDYFEAIDRYQPQFYEGEISVLISEEMSFYEDETLRNLAKRLHIKVIGGYHDKLFDNDDITKAIQYIVDE